MRSYCLCQKEDVSRKWNGPCGREVAEFDDGACNATVAGPDLQRLREVTQVCFPKMTQAV
jgi:hypothetical protein